MNHTTHYNLNKPEGPELYDVTQFNENADLIDTYLYGHISNKDNPHGITKKQLGLENVDNTSDYNKPISRAVQAALDQKADKSTAAPVTGVKGNAESTYRTGNVNITKANIGLENVQNVTTNNQTPTYSMAGTLSKLTSGETLAISMGKIAKAINDLIEHISNKNNPHEVKKEQLGLDKVGNFKAVSTEANQGLTDTEKANARANIGIGESIIFVRSE